MRVIWGDRMPVYGIEGDCILNKCGDYTLAYRVIKPELFTLSPESYEKLHRAFVQAIRVLPAGSVLHLQDWYMRAGYRPEVSAETSWLGQASNRHFYEREWLDHEAYLFLTQRVGGAAYSATSQLIKPYLIPRETLNRQAVEAFQAKCGQFVRILTDSGLLKVERLGRKELWSTPRKAGLIERYCSLGKGSEPVLRDIHFDNGVHIGTLHTRLYTLADVQDWPEQCSAYVDYEPYSTEQTHFTVGFGSVVGPLLPFEHICNQFVFVEDARATLKKLESKRVRLQSLSAYSRENAVTGEAVEQFLNEAARDGRQVVRSHMNVFAWSERVDELPEIHNRTSAALVRLGATPKVETVGAPQIWFAGLPGNEGDFPMNETFITFAEQPACFFQWEGNSRSSVSPFGVRLGDRLTGMPLQVDIDREAREQSLIGNFNAVCISGSGGGKSFFLNHLVRSYYEQGGHVLIIDVGHSYELQCALHGGVYFTFEANKPLAFNPFRLGRGESLDPEKKEALKLLLLAVWKTARDVETRSEYVGLSTALQLFFDRLERDRAIVPGFNSFYEFLRDEYAPFLAAEQVREDDFDLSNFLYVLSPYYRGGEFDYLLNAEEEVRLVDERFIVFELDAIKDHPILYPVVTLVIMELTVSKMRRLPTVFKTVVIEEAWQQMTGQGMGGFMKFLEKTARKFFTKVIVCTQELEDTTGNDILKNSIINNSDTVILLDQSKLANNFGQLEQLLSISKKQKAEVLSLNRGREAGRRYKDVWIRLGPSHSRVYRLEVSDEEYCIYTSERREKKVIKDYIQRYGGVIAGVRAFLQEARERGGRLFLILLLALGVGSLRAQDPTSVISSGITRVIKAFDLRIQRIQTQTIWLEEAQRTIENVMSQLQLADIRDWVQKQKDLYDQFFQELWQVKSVIGTYHRVAELVQRQEQIVAGCKQGIALFGQDKHFSVSEVAYMGSVYGSLLKQSVNNLDQLLMVITSFNVQMSDEARLAIIDRTAANMDRDFQALSRFNAQNALLSRQRAAEEGEIDQMKKLYGL